MKKATFILFFSVILICYWGKQKFESDHAINSIIGDVSYIKKYGHLPTTSTNEDLRIKAHLEYVEELLRKKNTTLSEKRKKMLDLLHEYWTNGIFPRNYDYTNKRIPCFIDKNGRICAVGYLIEKTSGREIAEQINLAHKYDKILEINDKSIDEWIINSGLSKEECAMIQPSYGWPTYNSANYNHITPEYGISSGVLSGLNTSVSLINSVQISNGATNRTMPVFGLIAGATQITLGIAMLPKQTADLNGNNTTNESQKNLSFVNIGFGTASVITSVWNLIINAPKKDKRVAFSFFSFPAQKNHVGIGFNLTKAF